MLTMRLRIACENCFEGQDAGRGVAAGSKVALAHVSALAGACEGRLGDPSDAPGMCGTGEGGTWELGQGPR